MKPLDPQFEDLVAGYLEGRLSERDEAALRTRLHEDSSALSRFVELSDLHALLTGDSALAGQILADGDRGEGNVTSPPLPKVVPFPSGSRSRFPFRTLLQLAASICIAASALWLTVRPDVALFREVGGEITGLSLTGFSELVGHEFELKKGLVELRFRKADALVVIEAPAKFTIQDAKTVRVENGRITAHVRDGRQGLRVITPHTDVLDLGTRFGVDVRSGERSEVHVFEGKVEAGTAGGPRNELLSQNQARRYTNETAPQPMDIRSGSFIRPEEIKPLVAGTRNGQAKRALAIKASLKKDPALIRLVDFENPQEGLVIQGARNVQGRFPGLNALEFVDSEDNASLDLNASVSQLTLMSWVRLDQVPDGISSLYHTDGWNKPGQVHWMILRNGQMRFAMFGERLEESPASKVGFPESRVPVLGELGRWIHLAAVYDSEQKLVSFFVNGTFDSSVKMTGGLPALLGKAEIGNWNLKNSHGTKDRRFRGRMDELIVLSRALSPQEIRDQYEAGTPYQ